MADLQPYLCTIKTNQLLKPPPGTKVMKFFSFINSKRFRRITDQLWLVYVLGLTVILLQIGALL